jgi:hypothetical protein
VYCLIPIRVKASALSIIELGNVLVASERKRGEVGAVNLKFLLALDVDQEAGLAGEGTVLEAGLDVFGNAGLVGLKHDAKSATGFELLTLKNPILLSRSSKLNQRDLKFSFIAWHSPHQLR